MEIAVTRLPPIAQMRPLTAARCARLPADQLKLHHQYYNEVLALVEHLRAERYRLPPDPVMQATEPRPDDDEATAIHKSEYARLHKSLAREMTRGCRQADQLGDGSHVLSEHVQVEIAGPRVVNYRSDGSSRYADLDRQTLVEISEDGVPEAISRQGTTLYSGSQAFPLPTQKSPARAATAIPPSFSLVVGNPSVEVLCRTLPTGLIEMDFQGHHLQVAFSEITPNRRTLEKIAYNYLEAVKERVPTQRLAKEFTVTKVPQAPPKISGNLKPQPLPPLPQVAGPAAKKKAEPVAKKAVGKAQPAPKQPAEVKPDLKPKPPSPPLRIQLASGAKLSSTKARLRKARKLAAKVTKYDPHPATFSVKEQVARRLAILSEEELEAFQEEININPSGHPSREGWLNEEWLYQKSDQDPLLLLILQLLS
ncbi:MAG: hypothetical protein KF760_18450 [Candidatus Eremiobacteraeota bacterium]|nr:hypothetical protein [Candidatus Eremiobacteraeota bacterium]MCW5867367.1 hypothetical protein [Candidatus Eremiobacteraeota bacterium]